MPRNAKRKGTPLKTGHSVEKRAAGQPAICEWGAERPNELTVAADTLYTVAFKSKSGTEVLCAMGSHEVRQSALRGDDYILDPEAMYSDLLKCYRNAHLLIKQNRAASCNDPLVPAYRKLDMVLHGFRNILPHNMLFNVERDEKGKYFFIIYSECSSDPEFNFLFIERAVKKLRRNSKRLHDLFIRLIKALLVTIDIDPWWRQMDYTFEMVKEDIEMGGEGNMDKREVRSAQKQLAVYTSGEASQYRDIIRKEERYDVESIELEARGMKQDHPIVKLVLAGCEILKEGFRWTEFEYEHNTYELYYDVYLRLYYQCGISWTFKDMIWGHHEEYINSEANEGVQQAVASCKVTANTKVIDLDRLQRMREFPDKLGRFFDYANNMIREYE